MHNYVHCFLTHAFTLGGLYEYFRCYLTTIVLLRISADILDMQFIDPLQALSQCAHLE